MAEATLKVGDIVTLDYEFLGQPAGTEFEIIAQDPSEPDSKGHPIAWGLRKLNG